MLFWCFWGKAENYTLVSDPEGLFLLPALHTPSNQSHNSQRFKGGCRCSIQRKSHSHLSQYVNNVKLREWETGLDTAALTVQYARQQKGDVDYNGVA